MVRYRYQMLTNDWLVSLDSAVALVPSGAHLAIGGRPLHGKPMALVAALARGGRRDLAVTALFGSLDIELLVGHGAVRRTRCAYVGLDQLGAAPLHAGAAAAGAIEADEQTEYLVLRGLEAAGHGLPFLPTRAGRGSQVLADRGIAAVTCPYTGEELAAVPALAPDVALLHAPAADRRGNVVGPPRPSFLWDHDLIVARAARTVIVSVERILDEEEVDRDPASVLLHGFEVTAVVECPGGAAPTAAPGGTPVWDAVRSYLDRAAADGPAAAVDLAASLLEV
jgi:glutaconate CoA-transferase subunit A